MRLTKNTYRHLTTNELRPGGWLERQLRIQADGLAGNLDKIWPDVKDSKWIGGSCEGWERVPCWLDGFIPLAFLLDDSDRIARAKFYIDEILSRQAWDGWICPCPDEERRHYDVWPAFLMCKVFMQYHECCGDPRMYDAVYRILKQLYAHIELYPLYGWASARWFECLIPAYWLYEKHSEEWIPEFCHTLAAMGFDYEKLLNENSYALPEEKKYWRFTMHAVNMAMALKSQALYGRLTKKCSPDFARFMHQKLLKLHGNGVGHFTGDECLSGTSPVQGSELCNIVEAMYSFECLFEMTGDIYFADELENLAFNSLPAAFLPDMWAHQYVQLTNQVECSIQDEKNVPFNSNNGEAHLFGLEPHYGCCTANHGHGWPKFALSAIFASSEGFVIASPVPVTLHTKFNDTVIQITVESDYPFRDRAVIRVKAAAPTEMTLSVRIPSSYDGAVLNGNVVSSGEILSIKKVFFDETIVIDFIASVKTIPRPGGSASIKRGPLYYALPIRYRTEMHEYVKENRVWASYNVCSVSVAERKFPYCDYELFPLSNWNYALAADHFSEAEHPLSRIPFDPESPPKTLCADGGEVLWKKRNGFCLPRPENNSILKKERLTLIPYACAKLRIAEFPYIKS